MTRAALVLALALLLPAAPGPAAARERSFVASPHPPGVVESALTSCAGGAMIGALLFYAGTLGPVGLGAVVPGAGLFCGLSVVATVFTAAGDHLSHLVDHFLAASHPAAPEAHTPETVP
jgi:hypothetical protein